ncbi:peptidoglycan/LPS O-acetylase OafA/YrhL [Arthrobacter sp. B3I9]|uniref:acyltransferase family protein n=1 Tax=Arthrobacter sp. B3I9 TaxID=3042270 RepID=UPI0027911239|nr:acyltransferase family protein [Arthrobacter sp. B3I9]MDQ0849542.1 peptidoglycan/LPS O-acetylase OafA/YrhL [Arthrobacter sp. B3I9]
MTAGAVTTRAAQRRAEATNSTRKDIQALRALAVGLVVLNHLWPTRLTGGYVGVDVFFVISGYLISKHVLGELERTGSIRLGTFYSRRIKRLLPAAMVVAVVALIAAWIILPFSRWLAVAQETMAAMLYVENWMLAAKSVNYSAHNNAASTVQHYWSLSVEEQFYLLWPVLFMVLFVLASRLGLPRRSTLAAGVALTSAAALGFCIWVTYAERSQAYFVTPARVWEFGAGALIAVGGAQALARIRLALPSAHLALSGIAQWLGYGMIAYSALAYNEQTYFPGFAAALPVAGTLLVIASGPDCPAWSPNAVLAVRPVQFVGDVSYSLYLWHWPLIVLAPTVLSRNLGTVDKVGILVVAVVLSYVSKALIEDPGRTRLLRGAKPGRVVAAMAASVVLVCALCGGLLLALGQAEDAEAAQLRGLAGQPCYGARSLDPANNCEHPFGAAQVVNVGTDEAPWFDARECSDAENPIVVQNRKLLFDCDFTGGAATTATVWLVGDSHAEQWKAAVFELARLHKWKIKESLLGGCPFIDAKRVAFMGIPSTEPQLQQRCLEWSKEVSQRIVKERPDMVFTSAFGAGEQIEDGTGRPQSEQYQEGVTERFREWTQAGTEIYVIRDTPLTLNRSGPDCVALNPENPVACANARAEALVRDPVADAVRGMASPKIKILDLSDQFCNEQSCHAVIGGLHVYYDTDHVSRSYIKSLVPVLAERFNEARR